MGLRIFVLASGDGKNGKEINKKEEERSTKKKMRSSKMEKKFPSELEMDILSRLPLKSLLRFKCVCKEWLRLLTTDPHFINNMHLPRLLKPNSIKPYPSLISIQTSPVDTARIWYITDYTTEAEGGEIKQIYSESLMDRWFTETEHYRCFGVCNGLVCLSLHKSISNRETMLSKLHVWNPLTRDYITLSSPLLPPAILGFGFHQATNEYKVVRILIGDQRPPYGISVYTLGTKTWRYRGDVSYDFNNDAIPVTINGAPHWLVTSFGSKYKLIITFDMRDEVFQEIPLPLQFEDDHSYKVNELVGLLSITIFKEEFEMWVMKEHGIASSWTKLFNIRQSKIPKHFSLLNPIGIAGNGDITFRSNDEGKVDLLLYNPETKSFKGPKKFRFYFHRVFTFAGSLVSPKVINGGAKEITLTEDDQSKYLHLAFEMTRRFV